MSVLPGPLHRLTPLKDDPSAAWLTPLDRLIVTLKGWAAWALYAAGLRAAFLAFHYVITAMSGDLDLGRSVGSMGRTFSLPGLLTAGLGAMLIIPMRRAVVQIRASATAKMARRAAVDAAATVDDLALLANEPDGRLVSLVGWVRGHGYLYHRAAGERAVGLTLRCQDTSPFVMETMHNFDLLDETGNAALVVTAGARICGAPNVRLSRANDGDRQLVMSLDLPPTTVPTDWNAFV